MTTTVTLSSETAEQSLLAYAVMKGYHPTVQGEVTKEVEEEVITEEEIEGEMVNKTQTVTKKITTIETVPNPISPLEYISKVKQQEMVDDMLVLNVKQIEANAQKQIEMTKSALSQAVNVTIE